MKTTQKTDKKKIQAEAKSKKAKSTKKKPTPRSGGLVIETKARLGKIEIKSKSINIDFKDVDLRADQVRRISIWTKEDEPLFLNINGEIGTAAKLYKCITSHKGDELQFAGLNYSARQCEQLVTIVKSEAEIEIKIQAETNSLFPGEEGGEKSE